MRRLLILIGILLSIRADAATQLQTCLEQTDVYTVLVHSGSATLNTATFNFDNLIGTITFKGTTVMRMFTNTNQNAITQFQNTTSPDAYFSTFSRTYHESLLGQTMTQACPLLTQAGGYLLTH